MGLQFGHAYKIRKKMTGVFTEYFCPLHVYHEKAYIFIPRLHDRANIEQTSSKRRANIKQA